MRKFDHDASNDATEPQVTCVVGFGSHPDSENPPQFALDLRHG